MQPKKLTKTENFNNWMALKMFTEACMQWMTENKNFRYDVRIETTFFDFGQDWKWTTIVVEDEEDESEVTRTWQAFCPRDWELIATCDSIQKLTDMAWYYMDELAKGEITIYLYKKFE